MNIWHDINPDRITPNDFMAVIEIENCLLYTSDAADD